MKKLLMIGLICLNAVLVVALTYGPTSRKAKGQMMMGSGYLVMTGQIKEDYDALWIIDLRGRKLAALKFNKSKKKLEGIAPAGGRDLARDFNRRSRR